MSKSKQIKKSRKEFCKESLNVLRTLQANSTKNRIIILDYYAGRVLCEATVEGFHSTNNQGAHMQCRYHDVCNAKVLKKIIGLSTTLLFIDSAKLKY